jgi:hypothetical protein
MQTSSAEHLATLRQESPPKAPQTPFELDPQLLKHISGGAPKGGWAATMATTYGPSDSQAPKGGW